MMQIKSENRDRIEDEGQQLNRHGRQRLGPQKAIGDTIKQDQISTQYEEPEAAEYHDRRVVGSGKSGPGQLVEDEQESDNHDHVDDQVQRSSRVHPHHGRGRKDEVGTHEPCSSRPTGEPGEVGEPTPQRRAEHTGDCQRNQERHDRVKDEDHADFGKPIGPDSPQGELAICVVTRPDHLGDPRFVEAEEHAPEVERPDRGSAGPHGEGREEEEMGEVQPVGHDQRPGIPDADLERGAGEHLGADQDNHPDE